MSENEVDYIVVGAGSAGCALANRLSAVPDARVALVEAGEDDRDKWLHIPVGMGYLLRETRFNWAYRTEPDPGINGRVMVWPRGKVLGGSSSINGMVYIRGQHADFDRWAAQGATGWSWQDLLPYFRKHEDQQRGEDAWHGIGGPIAVGDRPDTHPLWHAFIDACASIGVEHNRDFNGAEQEGSGYFQSTIRRGRRCSAAVGYLPRAVRRRPNLRILTEALTTRIVFENQRAIGVRVRQGGEERLLRCTKEVVLAAGAINSPQLLMLSGIGPAAELGKFGIPIIHDAPGIGGNLQDHLQLRMVYRLTRPISFNDTYHSKAGKLGMLLQYVFTRKGPMAYPTAQTGLFLRSRPDVATPDIQYHFNNFSIDPKTGFPDPFAGMTFGSCQLRPESRGRIRLASPDPTQAPRIQPNYLASELDRELAIASVKLTRRLVAQPAFAGLIAGEERPRTIVQSNDEILEFARNHGTTLFHPVGTCRMGSDAQAVVDPQLRVRGVDGLRVADASVMPSLVSGNTNAAVFVIGEKAADLVLAS